MCPSERGPDDIIARVDAMSSELRLMIIAVLCDRPASASQIAAEVEEPVAKVRYQLRRLREAGLVEIGGKRTRRGVVEHVYLIRYPEMTIDPAEIEVVSEKKRTNLALHLLKAIFSSSIRALKAGAVVGREDTMVSWMPMRVDHKGWEDLTAIHWDVMRRIEAVKDESTERLRKDGGPSVAASSILLWFETPRRDE